MITINQEINIGKIKALKYQNVSGVKVKKVDGWAMIDGDSLIKSTIDPATATENNKFTADIILKALPGCEDMEIAGLPMMDLVYPKAAPKYNPLEICAKDKYGLDSLFTFEKDKKDRFTKLAWNKEGGGSWEIIGKDTVAYIAGEKVILMQTKSN